VEMRETRPAAEGVPEAEAAAEELGRTTVVEASRAWWVFLVTGIAWFLVSLIVLRFRTGSLVTVGILLGAVFIGAGLNEFVIASVRPSWRWVHALLGLFFLAGAVWAFVRPIDAFWALASVLGFLLVFKGSLDIMSAVLARDLNELWWLGLTAGILEILLGFWVSQQLFPARAELILLWVGFLALFRGFSEIAVAFQLRRAGRELRAGLRADEAASMRRA
jgi:uncharacterized membrane protein HdeD (DUF308 family)